MNKTFRRLSKDIAPLHYKITMRPNLENFTFSGHEIIQIQINKPMRQISLHSVGLKLFEVFWESGKNKIEPKRIRLNEKEETATFEFSENINGKGKLHISFSGELTDSLRGYYKSSYTHKRKVNHISTTQFEATDARRAFPNFDEPGKKAVFEVSLIIPKSHSAISNTIESSVKAHDSNYKVVNFAPSPKMSTYLLAFITGEFESVKTKTKNGVTIRVFTTPGKTKHAQFALDVAKKSLDYMDHYFAIPYPLPVLDLIAIPDFASGAMENWGAVTFRETALLIDEKNTPFINRQRVAEVIAHELVHQWFGNLVTMEWWTHLWLNESFATYMAYKAMEEIFPEWQVMTKFMLNEYTHALQLDSLQSTHPIEVPVNHPSEINQIFDAISYSKGASVLRMLENYIGGEHFRDGLRLYLKKHSYKNTSSIHLWEAFEKASNKPVQKFMKEWTTKSGYPVVSASMQNNIVNLEQKQFQLLPAKTTSKWIIPIQSQITKDKITEVYELQKPAGNITISPEKEFFKLNAGQHGFYRSAYDPSLLARLLIAIDEQRLSINDRLGLVNDIFSLAKAGYTSTDVFLEALNHIGHNEESYVVWSEIAGDLGELNNLLADTPDQKSLEKFINPFFAKLIEKLGWEPKSKETTAHALLRAVAIRNAGFYGNLDVIKKAKQLFANHINGKLITPNLRLAIYLVVAQNGTSKEWNAIKKLYEQAEMQEERNRLGYSLMMFEDHKLAQQSVDFAFSDQVRIQDQPLLIGMGLQTSAIRPIIWKRIQKDWDEILKRFARSNLLSHIIGGLGSFTTEQKLNEVKQFFKTHNHIGGEQKVKQVIESITININWLRRDQNLIKDYLKSN